MVIDGAPGVGKEEISTIVASRLGWPRLRHHDGCAAFESHVIDTTGSAAKDVVALL